MVYVFGLEFGPRFERVMGWIGLSLVVLFGVGYNGCVRMKL